MPIPDWFWYIFIFAFGCCLGSFLNVVIYRMPRDKSLISPPSSCPRCGKRICFYDNIPLVSWLVLGAKCRHCKSPISPRYFVIEMLTGSVFVGLFVVYFRTGLCPSVGPLVKGGWFIYVFHIVLLASLIAVSAIDMELWVIPISVCWLVTAVGLIGSGIGPYAVEPARIRQTLILPSTSDIILREVSVASLAAGALIGLLISWLLLVTGLIKRSYESQEPGDSGEQEQESTEETQLDHRGEISKEVVYLLPVIVCSLAAYCIVRMSDGLQGQLVDIVQQPVVAGVAGSLWGYFVGCGVVWMTRILGTLLFGKEAMGLGDVHLMGAVGAVIGSAFVFVAFFVAPFLGLVWAGFQMFFRKTRQIPYGPFLSLGTFAVMIFHDWILSYWNSIRYP